MVVVQPGNTILEWSTGQGAGLGGMQLDGGAAAPRTVGNSDVASCLHRRGEARKRPSVPRGFTGALASLCSCA